MNNTTKTIKSFKSWRPRMLLRAISRWIERSVRVFRIYQKYRARYPGYNGFKRIIYRLLKVLREGGLRALRRKLAMSERSLILRPVSVEVVAKQYQARRISLVRTDIETLTALDSTIIFDHYGGGGAILYTKQLINNICKESVLRIFNYEAVWIMEWISGEETSCYYTSSIEELFDILSLSHSTSIILNSLYGYTDVGIVASKIIDLAHSLNAKLDIKVHDFYAICPSPHLLDFEEKYCGVPKDIEVCRICLKSNIRWYHSWYPKENRVVDITVWRKAFADLFKASDVISFFDQSSVDILRQAFTLNANRISISPHSSSYFKCDTKLEASGPLHIGILGNLNIIKGEKIVVSLNEHIRSLGLKTKITVVGSGSAHSAPGINVYGKYEIDDLPKIIERLGVNVVLMSSIVPETFSYTISEAIKMGLPIVAFDLGAQGNRVRQYDLGKVVPLGSSSQIILEALESVLNRKRELYK